LARFRDWFGEWTVFIAAGIAAMVLIAGCLPSGVRASTCADHGEELAGEVFQARETIRIVRQSLEEGRYIHESRDETLAAIDSLAIDLEEAEVSLEQAVTTIELWYENDGGCLRR
jgi:hypothetical protein